MADARRLSWTLDFKDEASGGIKDVDKKFTGAKMSAEQFGKGVAGVGKGMSKWITAPLAAVGAASVKTVSDFDDGMSGVAALAGATGDEFDKLRRKAIDLGQQTAFSASDAAEGMQVLASAGRDTNEILDMSEDMFNLMSAATVDSETAASVLNNTMAQYNLQAKDATKIADTFAKGQAESAASVENLEYIMGQAGGTMASMNMDMQQSVAAAGHLANAGTPIGQVGSIINAMGREIKANADGFKDMGIEVYDSQGKLKDMGAVMADLEKKLKGKTDAERDAALATVFSGQAQKGAIDWMAKGSVEYDKLTGSIRDGEGAAADMAEAMEDNIGGAFRSLGSSMETLMIEVGDVLKEPIKKAADFVAKLADTFAGLDQPTKDMIVKIGLIAGAVGPVLLIGGKLISGIAGIPGKIKTAKSAFKLIGSAFNPWTVGIGLAIAAGVLLYKNWDKIVEFANKMKDKLVKAWDTLKTKTVETFNNIKEGISNAWNGLKDTVVGVATGIKDGIVGAWEGLKGIVGGIWDGIKGVIDKVVSSIPESAIGHFTNMVEHIKGIFEGFKNIFSGIWETIKNVVMGAILIITDIITLDFGQLKEDMGLIWNSIKESMGQVWEGIKQVFFNALGAISEYVSGVWDTIKSVISSAISGIKEGISNAWESIKTTTANVWNGIKETIGNVVEWLTTLPSRTLAAGQEMMEKLASGVRGKISEVMGAIKEVADGIWESIKELPGKMLQAGKDMMSNLGAGIKAGVGNAVGAAKDAVSNIGSSIRGKFTGGKSKPDGSHRTGANRIPFNNYNANLHKGEMVLTKSAADEYRSLGGSKDKTPDLTPNFLGGGPSKVVKAEFNPVIEVIVEGNASENTANEIARQIRDIVQAELDKFFAKLQLQI